MAKDQPTEQYTPKGLNIPIATREEVERNLDKLLKAPSPPSRYHMGKPSADGAAGKPKE
jgi:hypothetical protein